MKPQNQVRVLVAIDKFKDTLNAVSLCQIIDASFKKKSSKFQTLLYPLADGGDGFLDCMYYVGGADKEWQRKEIEVFDSLGELKSFPYLLGKSERFQGHCMLELASSIGLGLVDPKLRDPFKTSSQGLGEMIWRIVEKHKVKHFQIGTGGSSTMDFGIGAARELGLVLLDKEGNEITEWLTIEELERIQDIKKGERLATLAPVSFQLLCDVVNPVMGEKGAINVFGPQKGATPQKRERLRILFEKFAALLHKHTISGEQIKFYEEPCLGAAGGFPAVLRAIHQKTKIVEGAQFMRKFVDLDKVAQQCDYLITGEGSFDHSSLGGKLPDMVIKLAKEKQKPVAILCGRTNLSKQEFQIYDLMTRFGQEAAMKRTAECIEKVIEAQLANEIVQRVLI